MNNTDNLSREISRLCNAEEFAVKNWPERKAQARRYARRVEELACEAWFSRRDPNADLIAESGAVNLYNGNFE